MVYKLKLRHTYSRLNKKMSREHIFKIDHKHHTIIEMVYIEKEKREVGYILLTNNTERKSHQF